MTLMAEASDDDAVVKSGTLDDSSWLAPEIEIFADFTHPCVHDSDAPERGSVLRSGPT
jgi:hypothetical protein